MKRKLLTTFVMLFTLVALPVTILAESQTWSPPARVGKIYIIIRHKKSFPPTKTNVSVRWGKWSKSGTFDAAGWRYSREGFIIRLDHKKNDSVPLTVSTSGTIVQIYQGEPPAQKGDSLWESTEW